MIGRFLAAVILAVIAAVLAGVPARAQDAFYQAQPHELHGHPGTLIRYEPMPAPPKAALAYRILYRSVGLKGEPIAVSGAIAIPPAAASGVAAEAQGRPVVTWAHPTSGVARRCAPSLRADVFTRVHGLSDLLGRGFVVVATDYPGLGTAGTHPYLIGVSEGRAMLDAARAAREVPDAGAGMHVVAWGYSQGGHAALFAGTLAHGYAPELRMLGVAAEAPPTELGSLIRADVSGRAGKVLSAYALWSWSRLYTIPVDTAIEDRVTLVLNRLSGDCSESFEDVLRLIADEQPFEREGFLAEDVTVNQPWRGLIEGNTPGIVPSGIPVFIAQGGADTIVEPKVTELYRDELCSHRVPVQFVVVPGAEHTDVPEGSAGKAVAWIAARFAGEGAPDDCP